MTPEVIAARYFFFLLAAIGLALVCCGWRAYSRDAFRQSAFALRDQLFDFAAQGNVAFNDPAYYLLRLRMNTVIRYSHQLTFGEALLPLLFMMLRRQPTAPPQAYQKWHRAVAKHNKEVRTALTNFNNEFATLLVKHLIFNTPLAWPLLVLVALALGAREAYRELKKRSPAIEEAAAQEMGGELATAA
jgi:hypothetical protein